MKYATDEMDWQLRDALYVKRQVIVEIAQGSNRYEICGGALALK